MRDESLHGGGTSACPDESFGNSSVSSVEFMEVGIGLPLFKHELDWPPQALESTEELNREIVRGQVGAKANSQVFPPLAFRGVRNDDQSEFRLVLALREGNGKIVP